MSTSTLKPSQLCTLLEKAIDSRLSILITGAPGIGKTECEILACQRARAHNVIMHPVVKDPTDFKGMPWVTDQGAQFLPFHDLKLLAGATEPTVCFLDDLGQATSAVQAAAMQLILGRQIDGQRISDQVVFVAASNRRTDRAGVSGILEPVKSRFATIVELVPDLNDWADWYCRSGLEPVVLAFLRFKPLLFSDFKPTADLTNSPSPRGWHSVAKLLSLDLPSDVLMTAVQGAVGEGAGIEFMAFLPRWTEMVNPDVVLTSPDTAAIPSELSALCAVSTAIAMRVQRNSMARFCRYLERLCGADQEEFAALAMKAALARDASLSNTAGYTQAMSGALGQVLLGT